MKEFIKRVATKILFVLLEPWDSGNTRTVKSQKPPKPR